MKQDHQDTDQFLAVRYPNIHGARLLLEKFNRILGVFEVFNGGYVEIKTRFSGKRAQWNDGKIEIEFRDLMRDDRRT